MVKEPIALLGATGLVGQKLIRLLSIMETPFEIAELCGSERSANKRYGEACLWRDEGELPDAIGQMELKSWQQIKSRVVLSALPSEAAAIIEPALVKRGHQLYSNASTFRMDPKVPLLLPAVNAHHLEGAAPLICNPNCVVAIAAHPIATLNRVLGMTEVDLVSLQAISGAGYRGLGAFDCVGNTIPYIAGEEEKVEAELAKIFEGLPVRAHCHRVPVLHGHSVSLHLTLSQQTTQKEIEELFCAQPNLYCYYGEGDAPQPRRELAPDDDQLHIGRVKVWGDGHSVGLVVLGHNLTRGAALATIENALYVEGSRLCASR